MIAWIVGVQIAVAAEIIIEPSGTNDALFSAIQSANSGDSIVLRQGSYQECVNTLGKDLVIKGVDGAQIVGNGSCATLIQVEAGEVWIQDLTVSHKGTCLGVAGRSSTVHVENASILQCGNLRQNGGGVHISGGTVHISKTKLSGNQGQKGAGIYVKDGVLTIGDSLFSDNMAQIGGALFSQQSEVSIQTTRILGNATKSGGMGAGVVLRNGGYLKLSNTVLQGNHAQGKGGAIYVDTNSSTAHNRVSLKNVRCTGNSASFGSSTGGCLYSRGHASLTIEDSTFVDNMAALSGGAIAIHDASETVQVSTSTFQKNRARSGEGGAVLVESASEKVLTPLKVKDSTFENNRAETYGGALSLGNTINAYASLEISGSTFSQNLANSSQSGAGGAVYFVSQAPHTLKIVESTFEQNKAELAGGAVYAVRPQMVWIQQSRFLNNAAEGASTIQPRFGGAVMLDGATVTFVERSKFCGNVATSLGGKRVSGTGGGFYLQNGERLVFEDNWFWENQAQEQGGGLSTDTVQRLELSRSIFAANRSAEGGALYLQNTDTTADALNVVYTQSGVATMSVNGEHQWQNVNWYNNVNGNGSLGPSDDVPLSLTSHTTNNPNFPSLVVDGRCEDVLTLDK